VERYKDLSGEGGILAFEILDKAIILQFKGGDCYLYDYFKPGEEHVEQMKMLARRGKGLTTYVNQHVRANYSKKINFPA
jgi:hypothetical protein